MKKLTFFENAFGLLCAFGIFAMPMIGRAISIYCDSPLIREPGKCVSGSFELTMFLLWLGCVTGVVFVLSKLEYRK